MSSLKRLLRCNLSLGCLCLRCSSSCSQALNILLSCSDLSGCGVPQL